MIPPRPSHVDVESVRAALLANVASVLDNSAINYQIRADELRTPSCPQCGERSRDSVCISVKTGDDAGVKDAGIAIVAATDAGLLLPLPASALEGACTIRLVELGAHHDLADTYSAGWCWRWLEMWR